MPKQSREIWAKRIERWKDSGLTAAEFAAETGVNAHSLSWWKWRLGAKTAPSAPTSGRRSRRAPLAPSVQPLQFVELAAPAGSNVLEVVLARDRTIRVPLGFDGPTLERLLGILERTA